MLVRVKRKVGYQVDPAYHITQKHLQFHFLVLQGMGVYLNSSFDQVMVYYVWFSSSRVFFKRSALFFIHNI